MTEYQKIKRNPKDSMALHKQPERTAAELLKGQILSVADEVFDRYVEGESFHTIAASQPFAVHGWKLRQVLMEDQTTADRYATSGIERSHFLVDQALDHAKSAAAIGDASGLKAAIDTNLKVAAKLNTFYSDKSKVELTGHDGGPVKLLAMTDEQLLKIAAQASKEQDK
jgi:hypothetical protein